MVEVEFSGENVTYDLFADWDGTNYDSKDGVSPGYHLLGPFPINQDMGIIVEDEANPIHCFDNELVIAPINPTNCISTAPPPTTAAVQASNMHLNLVTNNSLQANWTRGNGDNVIVTATPCGQSISAPQDGVSYSYDTYYSQAPTLSLIHI